MEMTVETTGNTQKLRLEGDLTIEHAGELKNALSEASDLKQNVRICLERVASADVAVLQLICSAHRAFEAENRLISFEGEPSESFMRTALDAGFVKYSCGFAKGTTTCLWPGRNQ